MALLYRNIPPHRQGPQGTELCIANIQPLLCQAENYLQYLLISPDSSLSTKRAVLLSLLHWPALATVLHTTLGHLTANMGGEQEIQLARYLATCLTNPGLNTTGPAGSLLQIWEGSEETCSRLYQLVCSHLQCYADPCQPCSTPRPLTAALCRLGGQLVRLPASQTWRVSQLQAALLGLASRYCSVIPPILALLNVTTG